MPESKHILTSFDNALRDLKEKTIGMGIQTQHNLECAIRGLFERNKELCNQAIADDADQNQLEIEIDALGTALIIKYRPLAHDLRMVLSSIKTATHFESISDQSLIIAKRARKMIKDPAMLEVSEIEPLYQFVGQMLADALIAYTDTDTVKSLSIIEREKTLKKTHKTTFRTLSKKLESSSGQTKNILDLIFICRALERIGKLSINIAEEVIFEETAADIRHGGEIPETLR